MNPKILSVKLRYDQASKKDLSHDKMSDQILKFGGTSRVITHTQSDYVTGLQDAQSTQMHASLKNSCAPICADTMIVYR